MAESRALSQWEIDALLNQIPESAGADPAAPLPAGTHVTQSDRGFSRVIKTYDFRRPDKFSKEQWHTLQAMHETFARLVGASFSSRLRTLVTVRLSSIDQGLYEEWQSQVPSQTVCYVLSLAPLSGNLVVEFNSDVAIEVIDRLLGGNGVFLERGRDLGEIELALLRSFSKGFQTSLGEMWSAVGPVKPELQDLALDAGLIQVARPNDVVISAFFEVNLGNHLGAMSMCIPYAVMEPIAGKLSTQLWHGAGTQPRPTRRTRSMMTALLGTAAVDLSVELGSAELPVRSVTEMAEGSTLVLDARADRPLTMAIGGIRRFLCRPGQVGNQVGVRITDVIEDAVYDFDADDDLINFPGASTSSIADPLMSVSVASQASKAGNGDDTVQEEAAIA